MQSYRDFLTRPGRPPAIVVHRGAWTKGPENSVASMRRAYDAGHPVVEVDVQQAACGTLFLMHDFTLDRMTGHAEFARRLTMPQLAALRLRDRDGGPDQPFTEATVPGLAEVLLGAQGRGYLDLDVKFPELMDDTAACAAANGAADRVAIKIPLRNAADADRLLRLQDRHGVMVMPITNMTADTVDALCRRVIGVAAAVTELSFDTVETLHRAAGLLIPAGVSVWVNTLDVSHSAGLCDTAAQGDPAAVWGKLFDAGVSVIQTDIPDDLARFITDRTAA